jgi:hypothetical protein
VVSIATRYMLSGDGIPVGATFSTLVRAAMERTQSRTKWVQGLFPGGKAAGGGVSLSTHFHLAPRLKKE